MNQVAAPALERDPLAMARLMGLRQDRRIEKYAAAAKWFQTSWLLRSILFLGIRAGKVDERIVSRVAGLYRRSGWSI
jgi:hypothetical protein